MQELLARLPVVTLSLVLRPDGTLRVPAFPAAVVRSVLGAALARRAPAWFAEGFGGGVPSPLSLRVFAAPGRPEPAAAVAGTSPRGAVYTGSAPLCVEATWFGRTDGAPLLAAFEDAARLGFGAARVRARIDCVSMTPGLFATAPVEATDAVGVRSAPLRVRLVTPLRSRAVSRGTGAVTLPWGALLDAVTARLGALVHAYAPLHDAALAPALAALAALPPASAGPATLASVTLQRWSSRRGERVHAAGLTGHATFFGVADEARTLLSAASRFHAGSGASAGFGWLALESAA